jgi:protocatechuate 3,4-dioxygenase beta subunit
VRAYNKIRVYRCNKSSRGIILGIVYSFPEESKIFPLKKPLYTLALTFMVVSLICFFACSKSSTSDKSGSNPNNIPAEVTVTANLQGRVLDENGLPVQGAAVSCGTAAATTDVNGVFTFSKTSMSSRFGFVTVVKQGYFNGSRSIITNGGEYNYVSIQLIPRTSKGGFPAPTGGTITVQPGDTAFFPAAAVITAATNATYTGNVNVYATYLDPTASDLYKHMPGDLRGIGTDGKETALQSFGMLAVELAGDAGEKLQLAAGKKATLTWAIPASLQATAPSTIPLWYFNDSSGRWIEEGMAARVANSYVGQVGHFTYWNCDAPMGTVNFKVHLKDQLGNPLPYTYVLFQSDGYGTRGGYTDSSGFAQGLIPKGQTFVMKVVTECGNILAGANIGPALGDQDMGTITVAISNADLTLKGSVLDCSNNPVDSGWVSVLVDGLAYNAAVVKGSFNLPVNRCYNANASVKLTAGDFKALQVGNSVTITASTGTVDLGVLSTCGNTIDQFVTCNVNGQQYDWTVPGQGDKFFYDPSSVYVSSADGSKNIYFQFITPLSATGPYLSNLQLSAPGLNPLGTGGLKVNVTSFGDVNSYVTGTFAGSLLDSVTKKSYPVTGSLKVKRTQ